MDLCYTPMILADSFIRSSIARDLEYQYCVADRPVVLQVAANSAVNFADAVELAAPWVDGVDLNCGCPQGWAWQEGVGASLMRDPEKIRDMVRMARARSETTPISVKIRIFGEGDHDDHPTGAAEARLCSRRTVDLARMIEAAGASWISVHGRTRKQKSSEPVHLPTIQAVKQSLTIPVIANGDVNSLEAMKRIVHETGADGVMAARALLDNPALFAGFSHTPWECVERFTNHSLWYGTNSAVFHHHLALMTASFLSPSHHRLLNTLSNASVPTVLDFISQMAPLYCQ